MTCSPHVSIRKIVFSSLNTQRPDLFLIRPPASAAHCAVDPSHIVIAGDSAGGGLALGLLQILRDAELPMPAGGVLISPWCDLTHSFPSVHTNTATVSSCLLLSRHLNFDLLHKRISSLPGGSRYRNLVFCGLHPPTKCLTKSMILSDLVFVKSFT